MRTRSFLNNSKTVSSLVPPKSANVKLLAVTLAPYSYCVGVVITPGSPRFRSASSREMSIQKFLTRDPLVIVLKSWRAIRSVSGSPDS
jgi:hypothetical protein